MWHLSRCGLTAHWVLRPPHCPFIQSAPAGFAYKVIVEDSVKSLAKVQRDNMHCSSLIHPDSCFIVEGNTFHQVWIHADYSWSPSYLFEGIVVKLAGQQLPSCFFCRLGWHLLLSNSQTLLFIPMTFQRWSWVAWPWCPPAPSARVSVHQQGPWTRGSQVCLGVL